MNGELHDSMLEVLKILGSESKWELYFSNKKMEDLWNMLINHAAKLCEKEKENKTEEYKMQLNQQVFD